MVVVTINNRNSNTMLAVLVYLQELFQSEGIHHDKMLFSYQDIWKNLCSDSKPEIVDKPLYVVNPHIHEYEFTYKNTPFQLRINILDPAQLYKAVDNPSVFEHVLSLDLVSEEQEILDQFLIEALRSTIKWDTHNSSSKEIVVYHYTDDEFWDKLNTVEKRETDTIYLPDQQLEDVLRDLDWFLSKSTKKLYSTFGIPYHRTYCLHGPPGTGKSSLIMALVSHSQKNIGVLSLSKKTDDHSFIRAVATIPKNTFLLLEDIDCLLGERADKTAQITFSTLLNCLDGVQSKKGLVIFITTNYLSRLDPAFRRPGRIDYVMGFDYANKSQIFKMLEKFFPNQEGRFERFYTRIARSKITTCSLQKFFFEKYPDKDILEGLDQFLEDAASYQFEKDHGSLYT